jgi:hypothetical protein
VERRGKTGLVISAAVLAAVLLLVALASKSRTSDDANGLALAGEARR